ncbi:ferric reductase-like transmembrane domain-containing protein [Photobacterium sagamiensis]|uniref:ferredoxin reductase family protein n=1 Tax=Photobacterium sagamiensis TaxID=2910241 RepID=UPI003D0A2F9A
MILLTGGLGTTYMAMATLLAIRPAWLESRLDGLDKMYRLHKHLGIAALISLFLHWLVVNGMKWLVQFGYVERPGQHTSPFSEGIDWREFSEGMGDFAFKVFLIFTIISLVQAISYKKFRFVHKLGGAIFMVGAFHTLMLLDYSAVMLPFNVYMWALCVVGGVASLISLTGNIGASRKTQGEVIHVQPFKHGAHLKIQLQKSIHYKPGQFAYLDFHDNEAPHPFTVLNYCSHTQEVEFAIKDLGDYTKYLVANLSEKQSVTLEGPYGEFQPCDEARQIWVGAGIGIAPFVAWLEAMASTKACDAEVDFYYCVTSKVDAYFAQRLQALTQRISNVTFHLLIAEEGELLSAEEIINKVREQEYSVSFCGPELFANTLGDALAKSKNAPIRFQRELFNMR